MTNNFLVPVTAPAETALSAELADIERGVSASGWTPESRDRYRRAVATRDGVTTGDPKADAEIARGYKPRSASESRQALAAAMPALVDDWDASGGFDVQVNKAQGAAHAVLDNLHPKTARGLIQVFDALPATAQQAAYRDMALGRPVVYRDAEPEAVERFASTPEGKELVAEWGGRAARHVAVIRERLNRMTGAMTPHDVERFINWFDDLSPAQASALYNAMVK